MRTRSFLLVMLAVLGAESASGQERSAWFGGASFGPVVQDRQGNTLIRESGLVVQLRGGRRIASSLSAMVALTHAAVTPRVPDAFPIPADFGLSGVPCPEGDPLPCGADPFIGPVKQVIASAGFEAAVGSAGARVFATVAPGVYWLYERAPESRPASFGLGLGTGGSVRLMEPVWLVLDLQYHQVFSGGPSPRWLVPMALGLQVR